MADVREAQLLVRAYSFEVEERLPPAHEAHMLGHILAEHHGAREGARDRWRRVFEPSEADGGASNDNPIVEVLAIETAKLRERWKKFLDTCPAEDRLNLHTSEPTIEGVIKTVGAIHKSWESKRNNSRLAKAGRLFHRFCGTLGSHSSLMQVLPSGNEYVSVFAGALNVIVQASANHEKMAEGLSEALCTMSEHVEDVETDLKLFNREDMQKLVAKLYSCVFDLLATVMDWMMKKKHKRLLDSFNENLTNYIETQLKNTKHVSERIHHLAARKNRVETRFVNLSVQDIEDILKDIQVGLEGDRRYLAEKSAEDERLRREEMRYIRQDQQRLGDKIDRFLQGAAMWMENERASQKRPQLPIAANFLALSLGGSVSQLSETTANEIILRSRHLEDFFHRDRLRLSGDVFHPAMIDPEALRSISDWAKAPAPSLLWIDGPYVEADDYDNPITMMAAKIIGLAEETQEHVISYFCELRRGEKIRTGNDTAELQALLSLVYSLIRQLIEVLPPRLETSVDLSEERFSALDGSMARWSAALSMLADLAGLMTGPVFCIIDGAQWLDDRSTDDGLAELLNILRGASLKVLLTTSGRAGVLLDELPESERFYMENLRSLERGVDMDASDF